MEDKWLSVVIEEYKTLRTESIEAIKGQQHTFNLGIATVGILTGTALSAWEKHPVPEIILMIFLPLTNYLILTVWMGEVYRMMRAGYFISRIEKRVNNHLKVKKTLSWEKSLRKNKISKINQMKMNYYAIIALFILWAMASIAFGEYKIYSTTTKIWIWIYNIVEVMFLLIAGVHIRTMGKKIEKL